MSGREFLPGQHGSYNSNSNNMSPTLGKYLGRSTADPLPYWSPQTRGDPRQGQGQEYSSIDGIVESSSGSQNGLNLSAASWVPPTSELQKDNSQIHSQQREEGLQEYPDVGQGEEGDIEPMVEVTWNGNSFFVPESTAYAYEEGGGYPHSLEEDAGFEWANGSTTLPAPPKRSLQTIGIPEPIRQHFQSLDTEALRQMAPEDDRYKEIPPRYHSAFILDDASTLKGTGGSFGYPASLFKVRYDLFTYVYIYICIYEHNENDNHSYDSSGDYGRVSNYDRYCFDASSYYDYSFRNE